MTPSLADARRTAIELFRSEVGGEPEFLVRSPGRVNLIGDHTDYNDGFVLPMAIDRSVWLAVRTTPGRQIRLTSPGFGVAEVDLDHIVPADDAFGQYVAGVAWSLADAAEELQGWEGVAFSDLPVGAGLSSSAALELAVARASLVAGDDGWDPMRFALAAQRAENEWVGMACGIMDQLVVAAASPDAALLIDCRSLQSKPVPIPPSVEVVVVDSGTRRSLIDSAYNERRAACEAAAVRLGVSSLRDVAADDLADTTLPEPLLRRARHVVTENLRVLEFDAALGAGDVGYAGRLLDAGHASLRDDFEVSTSEVDRLVEILTTIDGVRGARMTGAGFGGCVVTLVDTPRLQEAVAEMARRIPAQAAVYVTSPAAGTSLETV